jgi:hypothetical protein
VILLWVCPNPVTDHAHFLTSWNVDQMPSAKATELFILILFLDRSTRLALFRVGSHASNGLWVLLSGSTERTQPAIVRRIAVDSG